MTKPVMTALALLMLAAAAGAGYVYFTDSRRGGTAANAALQSQPAPPAVPVEMAKVDLGTIAAEVLAVGSLRSNESVIIRPEIPGRITTIAFSEGEFVDKGARLFNIEDAVFKAELAEAQANLNLSKRNFARAEELAQKGAGTERARDEARAAVERGEASVHLARARLETTKIVAPFRGIIGLRKVSPGDYISPGQDLVNLEDIETIKVDFRIPERNLGALKEGQQIRIQLDAFPTRAFDGTVYAIDPHISEAGRSIGIRARIPNQDKVLRPGLYARVTLMLDQRENAILVSEQTVFPRGDSQYVFKVVDGKAVLTKVKTGLYRAGVIEIVEGLGPDDVIVKAGHLKIRDGSAVAPAGAS